MKSNVYIASILVATLAVAALYVQPTQYAMAIEVADITVGSDASGVVYNSGSNQYVMVRNVVDAETLTVVAAVNSTTANYPLAQDLGAGAYGFVVGCEGSSCYIVFDSTGSVDYLRKVSLSGVTLATVNSTIAGTNRLFSANAIYVSGSVYVPATCSAVDTDVVIEVFSSSLEHQGTIGDCAGVSIGAAATVIELQSSGSKIAVTNLGGGNQFQIWNTGGGRVCTATNGGISNANTGGHIARSGNIWFVTTSSAQNIDRYNDSCTDTGDISAAQHGLTTDLRSIRINSARNEIYIVSTNTVAVMDAGSPTTKLYTIATSDVTTKYNVAVSAEFGQVATLASPTLRITSLSGQSSEQGETVGVDTNSDGIIDYYIEDLDGDGMPDLDLDNLPFNTENFAQSFRNFVQNVIGVPADVAGIFVVMFIIVVAEMLLYTGVKDSFAEVPVFVHAIFVFMAVGAGVALSLIDVVYLYFLGAAVAATLAIGAFGGKGGSD